MNKQFNPAFNRICLNVWLALAALNYSVPVQAACVDNLDGTFTCSATSDNIDNPVPMTGTVTLDNASGPVILNNVTTDPEALGGKTTITNSAGTVGAVSTLVTNGANEVVITNIGGNILMDGSARVFNPAGWSNDAVGNLYNDGVAVGMAAAINATSGLNSLTINNFYVNDGIFHPSTFESGIYPFIGGYGDMSAALYTNAPSLTINNSGSLDTVYSFGGATYTPPAILDGTQYATVVSAGTTVLTLSGFGGIGSLYVVDRNPLLTLAQEADPALVLAYGPADVGPRNSVINVAQDTSIGNLYLGSGAHVVNVGNSMSGSSSVANIFLDQNDSAVVNVAGGVASPQYLVHGDRTFTYNSINQYGPGNFTIHDVAGAVNVINATGITGYVFSTIQADGLGDNTLNMSCGVPSVPYSPDSAWCSYQMNISGMSTINFSGEPANFFGDFSASGDINLLGKRYYFSMGTLTAANVVVGSGSSLDASGNRELVINQVMGDITGNLVNNGNIYLGDATLDVSGGASMNAGSLLGIGIGPVNAGFLNVAGGTSFAGDSTVAVNIKRNVLVRDGESHIIANNITGMPALQNGNGMVQWGLSEAAGNLVLTADVGISGSLAALVSPAARNAGNAFFSYTGNAPAAVKLQTELETLIGGDVARAAERLRPEINDGAIRMVLGNTDKLFSIVDSRLLGTYLFATAGIEEQSLPSGKGIWVQGFGDRGTQESMDGADGYGLSSVGMAAGADQMLDAEGNARAGFAFGYARGNITNSGNTVNNRIDTNSYMGAVYASRNWDGWYVNGIAGFGRHVYETHRQLLEHAATGSHDSWQIAARVDAGWPILFNDNFTMIPTASLDYSHIRESGYRERGKTSVYKGMVHSVPQFELVQAPINLELDGHTFDSFRAGLGGKAIYSLQEPGWAAEVELRAMLRHEFGDLEQDGTARFAVGGDKFSSPGARLARDAIQLGGSVRLTGDDENDQLTLLTSYDADIREKYFGQNLTLNLRYDFDQAPRYLKASATRQAAALARRVPEQAVGATDMDILSIGDAMKGDAGSGANAGTIPAEVDAAIATWLSAQSNKDMEVYFNSYAANFATPDGSSRRQWEQKRRSEITRQNASLKVSYMTVKAEGDRAMAVFTQSSGENAMQKIVDLENRNGRWLIVREDSIAVPE